VDLRLIPAAAVAWFAAWWLTDHQLPHLGVTWLLVSLLILGLGIGVALLSQRWRQPVSPESELATEMPPSLLLSVSSHVALALAGILAVVLAVGSYQQGAAQYGERIASGAPMTVIGRVVTEPRPAPFGDQYLWTLQSSSTQFEVFGPKLPYQSLVQVVGSAKALTNNAKPIARLSNVQVQVLQQPEVWWRATNHLRQALLEVANELPAPGAGLVPGMAIGDTSRVAPELNSAFKTSGLAHLTAVSGGHFAVILVALGYLIGGANLPRLLRCLVFAVVATGFVMVVRPEPAVIRAAAMCAVAIFGTIRGRKAASVPALAASILVLLSLDPWLARSYGFALSCAASAALAMFTNPVARRLTPWLGQRLSYLVAVPLVAQAGCAPILLLFTDGVATLTVLANLLVTPAVALATLLSLGAALLAPCWPWAAVGVARLAGLTTSWIAWVATRCAASRLALIPVSSGVSASLGLAAMITAVGVAFWRWHPHGWPEPWKQLVSTEWSSAQRRLKAGRRRFELGIPNRSDRLLAIGAFSAGMALLFGISASTARLVFAHHGRAPSNWQVLACNVGQGDATVIRTGTHSAIVVDTGNDDGAIDRCLRKFQITKIELLVLSHFHSDHVGGLSAALSGRHVGTILGPAACGGAPSQVSAAIVNANAKYQPVTSEVHGVNGSVTWVVLAGATSPAKCTHSSADDEAAQNNQSLVFVAKAGDGPDAITIVALGDLETQGQASLIPQLAGCSQVSNVPLSEVDIVKVAHHGSAKQSAALARCLNPKAAVFSVGTQNPYGHPTAKALELYAGVGAYEVRTDKCGHAAFAKQQGTLNLTCLTNQR